MMTRIHLLLLCAFSLSSAFNYQIDYSRCYSDLRCFVRESCIQGKTDSTSVNKLGLTDASNKLIDGCDAIIQFRFYTSKKYLIMMQVNASAAASDVSSSGIQFKQGDVQFKCDKSGGSGHSQFLIKSLQSRSDEKVMFCSFTLETTDEQPISGYFNTNEFSPTLEFETDSPHVLKFPPLGSTFWTTAANYMDCNPEIILSPAITDDIFRYHQLDTTGLLPFSCEDPMYLRIIGPSDTNPVYLEKAEEIKCVSTEWIYKANSVSFAVKANEKMTAHCVEKFCSLCPPLENIVIPKGTTPTNGISDEGCVTTTCADKPWMIDDGRVLTGEMKCEKDVGLKKTTSWYLKTANESIKVTKAACVETNVCLKASDSQYKESCPDGPSWLCNRRVISADGSAFSCTDDYKLKWTDHGRSSVETTSIKCDFVSGKFVDAAGNELSYESSVFCTKLGPSTPAPDIGAKEEARTASAGPIVGGVLGGLIFVGAAIAVIVVVVKRRKKAAYQAWLNQPLRQDDEADMIVMPVLRTPAEDLNYKNHKLEDDPRLPWDQRTKNPHEIVPHNVCFGKFDNGSFHQLILKEFLQYNAQNQVKIFQNIAKLGGYSDQKENNGDCGNFTQFWRFFAMCVHRNMDNMDVWEKIFRMVRVLHGQLLDKKITGTGTYYSRSTGQDESNTGYKGKDTFDNRIKMVMIRFAKPVLKCLGWTRKATDSPTDVWMRFFVVRVLAWANEITVVKELDRQSDLPLEELESPMRAIVLGFASAHLGCGREFRKKYWPIMLENPLDPAKDEYGTLRQHIMFGLCMAERSRRGDNQMFSVLDKCYKLEDNFTPMDMYWGYRGATEQFQAGLEAFDHFVDESNKVNSFFREDQLRELSRQKKIQAGDRAVKMEWMRASMNTLIMMAESTPYPKQYKTMQPALCNTLKFCEDLPGDDYNEELMQDRVDNLNAVFWLKKSQIEIDFSSALECAEPKIDPKLNNKLWIPGLPNG